MGCKNLKFIFMDNMQNITRLQIRLIACMTTSCLNSTHAKTPQLLKDVSRQRRSRGTCNHFVWMAWISSCWLARGCGCCRTRRSMTTHTPRACKPRQHVQLGTEDLLYNSGYMGSGVVMLMNDTTWLLLEKWQNVIDVTRSCQVSVHDD